MNYIALGSLQKALTFPQVIGNVVTAHTQIHLFLRYPEVWKDHIFVIFILRWEHQHKSRDIRSRGQVQTAIADATFQIILVYGKGAFIPFIHWHPSDSLLYPLIEP